MFKNKITNKLSLYFTMSLLIFAIFLGSVFMLLFRNYTIDLNKKSIQTKALSIAETIPNYLENTNTGMRGFGMYLNVINDLDSDDVWIIDQQLNLIMAQNRQGHSQVKYEYKDLPPDANQIIDKVFLGEIVYSEDFTSLLDTPSLTVGVPILNSDKAVIGAVLLHSPVLGVSQAIIQGIIILIVSIILALIVSFGLAIFLSRYFTKPLVSMNESALKLVEGDYQLKTNINQADEIGELATTLDTLAMRLDLARQEKSRLEVMRQAFVVNISHELKTPVTVMRGSLEALVDEVVNDPKLVKDYHKQMLNEAIFLERLVQDLLELSKLQSIDFKIEKTKISLTNIVDDVIRSLTPLIRAKDIKLDFVKVSQDYAICGDYGRIRQMLLIILDNAIKFSHKGGLVKVVFKDNKIMIIDQGIGISNKDLPYIFERFYKSTAAENKKGTGLGLAIAKNIAQRHEIDLSVESDQNQGCTFIFDLNRSISS